MSRRLLRDQRRWSAQRYRAVADKAMSHIRSLGFEPPDRRGIIEEIKECRYEGYDLFHVASRERSQAQPCPPLFDGEYGIVEGDDADARSGEFIRGMYFDPTTGTLLREIGKAEPLG